MKTLTTAVLRFVFYRHVAHFLAIDALLFTHVYTASSPPYPRHRRGAGRVATPAAIKTRRQGIQASGYTFVTLKYYYYIFWWMYFVMSPSHSWYLINKVINFLIFSTLRVPATDNVARVIPNFRENECSIFMYILTYARLTPITLIYYSFSISWNELSNTILAVNEK